MRDADAERRFRALVEPILAQARAEEIVAAVDRLDDMADIGELMRLLAVAGDDTVNQLAWPMSNR